MEAVNLLPAYARPGHRWAAVGKDLSARRVLTMGGAVAGAAAIALGAGFVHERSLVSDKQDTLSGVQAQLAEAQAKAEPLRSAESASANKLATVRAISSGRVPWENVLRNLALVLPTQVQLATLQVTSPTAIAAASDSTAAAGATAGAPTGFTVSGSASSQNRVALVLDRLAVLPWLSDVTLQSSTRGSGTGSGGADQFTISANFNSTGGPR
jgi:Tfp pilus assembly protein PilN